MDGWRSGNDIAISAKGLGFNTQPVKTDTLSPTACHRCNDFTELCCPGAKLRRWVPLLVTRFGVIPRV